MLLVCARSDAGQRDGLDSGVERMVSAYVPVLEEEIDSSLATNPLRGIHWSSIQPAALDDEGSYCSSL